MKFCPGCETKLLASAFGRNRRELCGLSVRCKACRRADQRAYAKAHADTVKARDAAYKARNREKVSAQRKALARAKPERERANKAASEARYPERVAARKALKQAVRSGKLKRGPCAECGATSRIHGHHANGYSKALDVVWLCAACHRRHHKSAALEGGR